MMTPPASIIVDTDEVNTSLSTEYFTSALDVWNTLRQYKRIHKSGVTIHQVIAIGYETLRSYDQFTDIFHDYHYIYDEDGEYEEGDPLTVLGYCIVFKIWHIKKRCFNDPIEASKYTDSIIPF
jgi:hypothetical protein